MARGTVDGYEPGALLGAHDAALNAFGRLVHAVPRDGWHAATPCTEWDVRDLVNHLVAEQLWVPPLLKGATLAEVGDRYEGDVLGDDPVAAWDHAAAGALAAFGHPGALDRQVQLSYGLTSAAAYCAQMTADAVVHSWDLARGIGADDSLDPDLVRFTLREMEPYADSLSGSGLFARPLSVPADADPQTRLLAMVGRRR
ncbi:TIGR03086 family metal-binding protein [Allostreptomyces psammosilenae]|uniref:Uncharacterized protein (TIGR03086 family) n=1 Tax=Allostreptomyces psammosilenae TaxID=1892865 RepID=A0A853A155_9ACTN|nr:TIGR03086 family metal-binding protein [Allostreptomyces psammosilenae]NYI04138.1 uncharacterized protein (TIGR03086 family) [Allostreptomyces psammosilenae]